MTNVFTQSYNSKIIEQEHELKLGLEFSIWQCLKLLVSGPSDNAPNKVESMYYSYFVVWMY